jgi:hypothetical protein
MPQQVIERGIPGIGRLLPEASFAFLIHFSLLCDSRKKNHTQKLERSKGMREHTKPQDVGAARYTVAPGQLSQITLKTFPDAACIVRREGETNPDLCMRLYADDEGWIRFYVRPSVQQDAPAKFVIESEAGGKVVKLPLELRAHYVPTSELPNPPVEPVDLPRPGDRIRPALPVDDLFRIPVEELIQRGYPIRPDPEKAPGAFNTWRRAVSIPTTIIEPHQVARPEFAPPVPPMPPAHPPQGGGGSAALYPITALNWSGYAVYNGSGTDLVIGTWRVPTILGVETGFSNNVYSSCWVGLDGFCPNQPPPPGLDLVQAGTQHDVWEILGWTFITFFAWTEFLPHQTAEKQISNFPVNFGDEIHAQVWVGNPDSAPTVKGAFAFFALENLTRSKSTVVRTAVSDQVVSGMLAAWIVERPSLSNSSELSNLTDYFDIPMSDAWAEINGVYTPYSGLPNLQVYQITMVGNLVTDSPVLSTVTPVTFDSMLFHWKAFH